MTKKSSYAWFVLLGLAIIQFCSVGVILDTSGNYMAPILKAHPNFTAAGYGLTSTVQAITGLIILLTVGKIAAKFGIKNMLIIGSALCVAMQLILSFANSLVLFYIAYALFGFAVNLIAMVSAPVLINAWFAKNHGALFGISAASMGLGGTVFSPIIGEWINTVGYQLSYRYCAIIIAILCTIACTLIKDRPSPGVLALWADPESKSPADTPSAAGAQLPGMTLKEALRGPDLYMLFLGTLLIHSCYMCVMLSIGRVAAVAGLGAVAVGFIYMLCSLVNCVGMVPSGAISDRVGPKGVILSGAFFFVALCLITLSVKSLGNNWFYVTGVFIGYSCTTLFVPMQLLVRRIYGLKEYAAILGIAMIPISIGPMFLPLFQGVYDETQSYNGAFIGALAISILGLLVLMTVGGRYKSASLQASRA